MRLCLKVIFNRVSRRHALKTGLNVDKTIEFINSIAESNPSH